jgi:hypothetical protein
LAVRGALACARDPTGRQPNRHARSTSHARRRSLSDGWPLTTPRDRGARRRRHARVDVVELEHRLLSALLEAQRALQHAPPLERVLHSEHLLEIAPLEPQQHRAVHLGRARRPRAVQAGGRIVLVGHADGRTASPAGAEHGRTRATRRKRTRKNPSPNVTTTRLRVLKVARVSGEAELVREPPHDLRDRPVARVRRVARGARGLGLGLGGLAASRCRAVAAHHAHDLLVERDALVARARAAVAGRVERAVAAVVVVVAAGGPRRREVVEREELFFRDATRRGDAKRGSRCGSV